jgi:peptide/nickel transport system substrate-binding protein
MRHRVNSRATTTAACVLALAAAAVAAVLAAGAPAASDANTLTRGGTLRIGIPEQFKSFDPYALIGRRDYQALQSICDTLFTYGPNYAPQGMLVDRWSNVGKTWTFRLRTGIRFTDGTPVDANAVKFSLLQVKRGPFGRQIAAITRIDVVNAHTLRIRLNKLFPPLPAVLTQQQTSIVSRTAYRKLGSKGFAQHPVCSGPFEFVSWSPGGDLVLKRNPNYWRKDASGQRYPYLDRVVYKTLPDPQAEVAALQAGDVDMIASVPAPLVRTLVGGSTRIARQSGLGWVYFFVNVQSGPLSNVHLRRAIELAIDRKAIVDSVAFGAGTPALGPINPTSWAYDPNITKSGFYGATANATKAKQELAAGGQPNGFKFTLEYPTEDPFNGSAQVVKAQLAKFGIDVDLVGKDIGGVLDDLFASKFDGGLMIDFSGRIDPELGMAAFYRTNDANNFEKYSNPQVDTMLNQAAHTSDLKKRASLYQRVQTILNQDAPIVLLYFPDDIKGLRSSVHGFHDLGDERIALYDVWLGK